MVNSSGPLNNLSNWDLDDRVFRKLRGTGFDTLRNFAKDSRLNLSVLQLLVEKYDKGKQAFVLGSRRNVFDITFGLEDVLYLTGLPIDGLPVTGIDPADTMDALRQYLGSNDTSYGKKGRISLTWLKNNFMHVDERIVEENDDRMNPYVRAYVMYAIGCTLAPSSGMTVSSSFLPLLDIVEDIGKYAWGAAYLACLHHDMGKNNNVLTGFYFPLMVFAYMRFPGLLCGIDIDKSISDRFPLAVNWSHAIHDVMRDSFNCHNVHGLREFFSNFKQDNVIWQPYAELPEDFLPLHLREQLVLRTSKTILICFEKAVHHRPEVCQRQLGLEGLDTKGSTIRIRTKQRTGNRKKEFGTDWRTERKYVEYIKEWDKRMNLLIDRNEADTIPAEASLDSGLESHAEGDPVPAEGDPVLAEAVPVPGSACQKKKPRKKVHWADQQATEAAGQQAPEAAGQQSPEAAGQQSPEAVGELRRRSKRNKSILPIIR